MIASRILIRNDICMKNNLINPYDIHKYIYSLFPKEDEVIRPFLFNDKGSIKGYKQIDIISKKEPLRPNFGDCISKNIPDQILKYKEYRFSVKTNPIKRKNKKDIPILGTENLKEWFIKKSSKWGFIVNDSTLETSPVSLMTIKKQDKILIKQSITFSGTLEIINMPIFTRSYCSGIGRGKAFGFGMLEIIPIY